MKKNISVIFWLVIIFISIAPDISWAAPELPKTAYTETEKTQDSGKMKRCEVQDGEEVKRRVQERNEALEKGEISRKEMGDFCRCFHDKKGKLYNSEGEEVAYCVELQETLFYKDAVSGKSGVDLASNYIYLVYKYGASIIGILCVLVIIVSGIQISMSGVIGSADSAKERIWAAVLSLLLLFGSGLLLKTINPGFFI
jgi:hypothetical protein